MHDDGSPKGPDVSGLSMEDTNGGEWTMDRRSKCTSSTISQGEEGIHG